MYGTLSDVQAIKSFLDIYKKSFKNFCVYISRSFQIQFMIKYFDNDVQGPFKTM